MATINIPQPPTSAGVKGGILHRFALESTQISGLKWSPSSQETVALKAVTQARDCANASIAAVSGLSGTGDLAQVCGPYQQLWLNHIAGIIQRCDSPESRQSLCEDATTRVVSAWQTIQDTFENAPNQADAVTTVLNDLATATTFVNDIGSVAIAIPLRNRIRGALATNYPNKAWSELSEDEQANVTKAALEDAGLADASLAIKILGLASLAISVGLAFLNSSNNAAAYAEGVSKSLLEAGASYVGGNLTSSAFAASDASETLGGLLGTSGDVIAALIPVGFGIVGGILISAVLDVLFNVFFGVGDHTIPPELTVAITIPISVAID